MKKNTNKMYGCEIAQIDLPFTTKNLLLKYGFTAPIKVPVRRNCMTGSGIAQQCHANVMSLVAIYGGYRLGGYVVDCVVDDNGNEMTLFISHSVWVTPEGKAVDVTAHNFTDEDYVLFIPKYRESRHQHLLLDFAVPKHFVKDGILVNVDDEINVKIALEHNFELVQFNEEFTFFKIPSSRFSYSVIYQNCKNETEDDWKKGMSQGGFTRDSKWSKKSWDEIKSKNLLVA